MECFDTHKTATKKTVVFGLALVLAALLLLAAYAGLGRPASGEASQIINPDGEAFSPPEAPEDETLWLTVPTMARVKDLPVGTGPADDEVILAESALHVEGTGFPWEEGANVYIAGHRFGYEGEASYLVFYYLDVLQNGDEVILADPTVPAIPTGCSAASWWAPTTTTSPSRYPARAWSACRPAPYPTTPRGSSCRPR